MPITLNSLTRVLMNDGRASRNDAQILTRVVEAGSASRDELNAAKDVIEESGLPGDMKKQALRHLEQFLEGSATGLEAQLFGVDPGLANRLRFEGIDNLGDLLRRTATPAQRQSFASQLGTDEKTLRSLAKQADLQRVTGIDDKLARVLIDNGVDSVPELAGRNVDNLHDKLKEFTGTQEAWIIKFQLPKKADLQAMVDAAGPLDRVVSFGRPTSGWETLTTAERVELMDSEDSSLEANYIDENADVWMDTNNLPASLKDALPSLRAEGAQFVINYLDYSVPNHGATADSIADGSYTEADLPGNAYVEWAVEPSVTEYRTSGGELLGAQLDYMFSDDPASYSLKVFYDHTEGRFTEYMEYDHYNSEVHDSGGYGIGEASSGSPAAARHKQLGELTDGLSYISDSDEPFSAASYAFNGGDITAAGFKDVAFWSGSTSEVRVLDASEVADFWEYYTDPGTQSAGEAAKFATLKTFMESEFKDLTILKSGEPGNDEQTFWIMGKDDGGNLQGLRARSLET